MKRDEVVTFICALMFMLGTLMISVVVVLAEPTDTHDLTSLIQKNCFTPDVEDRSTIERRLAEL